MYIFIIYVEYNLTNVEIKRHVVTNMYCQWLTQLMNARFDSAVSLHCMVDVECAWTNKIRSAFHAFTQCTSYRSTWNNLEYSHGSKTWNVFALQCRYHYPAWCSRALSEIHRSRRGVLFQCELKKKKRLLCQYYLIYFCSNS